MRDRIERLSLAIAQLERPVSAFSVLHGEAREMLRTLPEKSVQCVVTSPPYYRMRKYDVPDQTYLHEWSDPKFGPMQPLVWTGTLGWENSPQTYAAHLVDVFREVKRVLRDDGTVWLNIGDTYAGSGKGPTGHNGIGAQTKRQGFDSPGAHVPKSMKPKDLMLVPFYVAEALRNDGWYLRSSIIWHKPNPYPRSVRDRPTESHEYVFLLSKNERYFYDYDGVAEDSIRSSSGNKELKILSDVRGHLESSIPRAGSKRNLRDVWTIPTVSSGYEHYSTFPEALVEPCIKAGTSPAGCCSACCAPYERVVQRTAEQVNLAGGRRQQERNNAAKGGTERSTLNGFTEHVGRKTLGWRPGCSCRAERAACTVLDPFCGIGTAGVVALRLGRSFIGIDLNEGFGAEATRRLEKTSLAPRRQL